MNMFNNKASVTNYLLKFAICCSDYSRSKWPKAKAKIGDYIGFSYKLNMNVTY